MTRTPNYERDYKNLVRVRLGLNNAEHALLLIPHSSYDADSAERIEQYFLKIQEELGTLEHRINNNQQKKAKDSSASTD